jgi:hypothetical protein
MVVARTLCRHEMSCGSPRIECQGDSSGLMSCTGSIRAVDYQDCFEDIQPDVQQLLGCSLVDAAYVDRFEACVNALADLPCETQAQVDERARQAEMGISTEKPVPAACEGVLESPDGCPGPQPTRSKADPGGP